MIRFLLNQGWGHYLALCLVWLACYYVPTWAIVHTDFYGEFFHPLQATIPIVLIYATYRLITAKWREWLSMVLLLQILHNLGDVLFDDDWRIYDLRQSVLNGMELAILVGIGLPLLIYHTHRAYRATRPADRGPDLRSRLAKGGQGTPGHV